MEMIVRHYGYEKDSSKTTALIKKKKKKLVIFRVPSTNFTPKLSSTPDFICSTLSLNTSTFCNVLRSHTWTERRTFSSLWFPCSRRPGATAIFKVCLKSLVSAASHISPLMSPRSYIINVFFFFFFMSPWILQGQRGAIESVHLIV